LLKINDNSMIGKNQFVGIIIIKDSFQAV